MPSRGGTPEVRHEKALRACAVASGRKVDRRLALSVSATTDSAAATQRSPMKRPCVSATEDRPIRSMRVPTATVPGQRSSSDRNDTRGGNQLFDQGTAFHKEWDSIPKDLGMLRPTTIC
jgi:hypothetical protein